MITPQRKVAVVLATLFILLHSPALADFSANTLIGYFTGISLLPDSLSGMNYHDHPSQVLTGYGSFVEISSGNQEVVRSLTGVEKKVGYHDIVCGVKRLFPSERAGLYLSFSNRESVMSWPFSSEQVRAHERWKNDGLGAAGAIRVGDSVTAGLSVKTQTGGTGNGVQKTVEIAGDFPSGIKGRVRLNSSPAEWDMWLRFKNITQVFPAQIGYDVIEGDLSREMPWRTNLSFSARVFWLTTPSVFRGIPGRHAQVWSGDGGAYTVKVGKTDTAIGNVAVFYGEDEQSTDFGFWFNGSQYLQGVLDGKTSRWQIEVQPYRLKGLSFPLVKYDRVVTDMEISRGILDSWPFTPQQIEILGDKTWTFSGKGNLISDAGTLVWKKKTSQIALTYARLHIDYRLRITTRDHFSANPWEIIFGQRRYESDRTRYFDFSVVSYIKTFMFNRVAIDMGITQIIPLYHAKTETGGPAPEPPSFPKLKAARPDIIGGLSVGMRVRWMM